MLPFLKKDRVSGLIIQERRADEPDTHDDNQDGGGLRQAAQELLEAVKSDNVAGVESALRAAFQILESEPHDETPQDESE